MDDTTGLICFDATLRMLPEGGAYVANELMTWIAQAASGDAVSD